MLVDDCTGCATYPSRIDTGERRFKLLTIVKYRQERFVWERLRPDTFRHHGYYIILTKTVKIKARQEFCGTYWETQEYLWDSAIEIAPWWLRLLRRLLGRKQSALPEARLVP